MPLHDSQIGAMDVNPVVLCPNEAAAVYRNFPSTTRELHEIVGGGEKPSSARFATDAVKGKVSGILPHETHAMHIVHCDSFERHFAAIGDKCPEFVAYDVAEVY